MTRVARARSLVSTRMSARIVYAVLGVFALVLLGFAAFTGAAQLFGTKTSATISSCHTTVSHSYSNHHYSTHHDTTCYGDWTLDGQQHHGEIHGVGGSDFAGEHVTVHVFRGDAYLAGWTMPIALGVGFLVCAGLIAFVAVLRRRAARKAAAAPDASAPAVTEPAADEPAADEPAAIYPWSGKDG